MTSRDPQESHRASTPLELLFDLCFVVAIAQASDHLHHGYVAGHVGQALLAYGLVFFAIWWAWMNFTWFASAYDTDDVPYRLKAFVTITGVLILAAGVSRAFEKQDFSIVTLGYLIMRVAMVAHWLRAARADVVRRSTALRYAGGLVVVQIGWTALAFLPASIWLGAWPVMVAAELFVPWWAERVNTTAWHPHHIAERYGLLALIVLGESILSSTYAIQGALDAGHGATDLVWIIVGGLLTVFGMWWVYFDEPVHHLLTSNRVAFVWGYGHLFVFAATAAVGAGLGAATDVLLGHGHLPGTAVGLVFAGPVALYVLLVWALQIRRTHRHQPQQWAYPAAAVLVLCTALTDAAIFWTGVALAGLVVVTVAARYRARA